jgi:hypothetical protein
MAQPYAPGSSGDDGARVFAWGPDAPSLAAVALDREGAGGGLAGVPVGEQQHAVGAGDRVEQAQRGSRGPWGPMGTVAPAASASLNVGNRGYNSLTGAFEH